MVDFFINRPVLATVLAILITLIGGISIPILPVAMSINVTFEIGYDLDIAAVDTQNRVQLATPRVPEEVSKYGISVNKQSTSLILAVNLISPDGSRDDLFLSNYIDIHISDVLKRIPGVGNLTIWGEREYSMRIWLDPDKLASLDMTTTDVANAIEEQNVQVAAGSIGQPPVPEGQNFQYLVQIVFTLPSAAVPCSV